jgi:hypothetical protein
MVASCTNVDVAEMSLIFFLSGSIGGSGGIKNLSVENPFSEGVCGISCGADRTEAS